MEWNTEMYEEIQAEAGACGVSDLTAAREIYRRGGVSKEGKAQAVVRWLKGEISQYAREKREDGLHRFPSSADVDEEGAHLRKQITFLTEEDVKHNIEVFLRLAKSNAASAMPYIMLYEERWGTCQYRPEVERILGLDYGDGTDEDAWR